MRNEWVLLLLIPLVVYSIATPYFILDRHNVDLIFYEDFESGTSNVKIYYATYVNYQLVEYDISENYTTVPAEHNILDRIQTIAIHTDIVAEYVRIKLPQTISGNIIIVIGFRFGQPYTGWRVVLYYQGSQAEDLGYIWGHISQDYGYALVDIITADYLIPLSVADKNWLGIRLSTPSVSFDEIRFALPEGQAPSRFFRAIDYIAIIKKSESYINIQTDITFNAYNVENITAYIYYSLEPTRLFFVQSNYGPLLSIMENWTKYDLKGNLANIYAPATIMDTEMAIWTLHFNRLDMLYTLSSKMRDGEPPYIIIWVDRIPPIMYEGTIHLPNGTIYNQFEYIFYGGTWVWNKDIWAEFQNVSKELYYGYRGHINNTIVVDKTQAILFGNNISVPFIMLNRTQLVGRSYLYNTTSGSILYVRTNGLNATVAASAFAWSSSYVGILPIIVKAGRYIVAWIPYYPWELNTTLLDLYLSSLLLFVESEINIYMIYDPRWIIDFDNVIFVGRNISSILVATNGTGRISIQSSSGIHEYNITRSAIINVNEYVYNIKVYNVTSIGFKEEKHGYFPALQTPTIIKTSLGGYFSTYTLPASVKLNMTGVYAGDITIAVTAIIYANTTSGLITRFSTQKLTTLSVLVLPYSIAYEATYIPTSVALLGATLLTAVTRRKIIMLAGSALAATMAYVYSLPIVL